MKQFFVAVLGLCLLLHCSLFDKDDVDEDHGEVWIEGSSATADTTAYYVSPNGNDQTDGSSQTTAFRSLAEALRRVKPGGSIRILPGIYHESIGLTGAGNGSDTIRIAGFGGMPAFDGEDDKVYALFIEECRAISVENLEIRNYTDFGIGASQSSGLSFKGLKVYENGHKVQLVDWELEGYGIHVDESSHIRIEDGEFFRNGPDPQVFPDRIMGTGINTYGNEHVVIRNNMSHHNMGGGILVEDSRDVLVEGNTVLANDLDASADQWWDGGLWLDGGSHVTVRDNLFDSNLGPGIEISDEDNQQPFGYVLENNVSRNNYYGILIWNFGSTDWPDTSVIQRSGNQFSHNTRQDVWIVADGELF